jgi:hypothetical protein
MSTVDLGTAIAVAGDNLLSFADGYNQIHASVAGHIARTSMLERTLHAKLVLIDCSTMATSINGEYRDIPWRALVMLEQKRAAATHRFMEFREAILSEEPVSDRTLDECRRVAESDLDDLLDSVNLLVDTIMSGSNAEPSNKTRMLFTTMPNSRQAPETTSTQETSSDGYATVAPTRSKGFSLMRLLNVSLEAARITAKAKPLNRQLPLLVSRLAVWTADLSEWLEDPGLGGDAFDSAVDTLRDLVITDLVELAVKLGVPKSGPNHGSPIH